MQKERSGPTPGEVAGGYRHLRVSNGLVFLRQFDLTDRRFRNQISMPALIR